MVRTPPLCKGRTGGVENIYRHEVDFLITRDRKPWFLVEVKFAETHIAEPLRYFAARLQVPGIQLVLKEGVTKRDGNILVISANRNWINLFTKIIKLI